MAERTAQDALDRALEAKDLLLVYQPIHDAATHKIYAAEALMRQRRESGEIREAGIITEAAEDGPDLFELDRFTMKRALTDAAKWSRQVPGVSVNVNLSPREFQEGDVFERVSELISGCGVDPQMVNLEITEVSYIHDPRKTTIMLSRISELGVTLWLDDFGTGHSTVEHLQLFPVDGVKIPGSFVKDLRTNSKSQAIVRGIIGMAHDVGVKVVAEGVEQEGQLDYLREWRCDYIQGFLFSRPMTFEHFEAFAVKGGVRS